MKNLANAKFGLREHFESCRFANNFLLSLQSYAFTPVLDKPPRVRSGWAALIDNILINQFNGQVSGGKIVSDISDHFSQFAFCVLVKGTKMSNFPRYRNFSSFSPNMILDDRIRLFGIVLMMFLILISYFPHSFQK